MAIATLDAAIAGMQGPVDYQKAGGAVTVAGRMYTNLFIGGRPGAAVSPANGVNGAIMTTYAGQLPFANGAADQYLARLTCQSSIVGTLILADLIWMNTMVATVIGAQAITQPALPARDRLGAALGDGVSLGLTFSVASGAGASAVSAVYTDQGGGTLNAAAPRVAYAAVSPVGTFYDFGLAAGDNGVRAVTSYTSTVSMTAGTPHLVLYREIARLGVPAINADYAIDALTSGMPKLHDNTVPFLIWVPSTTAAPQLQGHYIQTNG